MKKSKKKKRSKIGLGVGVGNPVPKPEEIGGEKRIAKVVKKVVEVVARPPKREDDPLGEAYRFEKAIASSEATGRVLKSFEKNLKGQVEKANQMKSYFEKEEAYLNRRIERNKTAQVELRRMQSIRVKK